MVAATQELSFLLLRLLLFLLLLLLLLLSLLLLLVLLWWWFGLRLSSLSSLLWLSLLSLSLSLRRLEVM